jgi:hypothetical protein
MAKGREDMQFPSLGGFLAVMRKHDRAASPFRNPALETRAARKEGVSFRALESTWGVWSVLVIAGDFFRVMSSIVSFVSSAGFRVVGSVGISGQPFD